ncbi:acyl-CoA dehydrogenase [Arcobacter aquimarinus]|uniref:Acyl-coenzyme A dehydrogenase n=2 Tax=Pseudomonadati TaxID=3379134 RepID=A0AAE7E2A1_9BACT|nr:acyl-CoA dehydrogenase [Arcobacter aquimarinus]QKE26396.1 acyl-CoA dehydrogenase [Arcobacter aquimarinus]RXI34487.1 acyl-CoA dehydrogenase [Arcobacter aquimarinus]
MEALVLLLIILGFGFFSFPLYSYFIAVGVYSVIFFDVGALFWTIFAILAVVFLLPSFRIKLISSKLVNFINKNGLLPKISQTEQAALQAGTNWVEADFFKAEVNFKAINAQKVTTLTQEEQNFLDNEVNELCNMTSDWEIFQNRDLSPQVWQFIKEKKFFGMIIPKEYEGLGFSATAHSKVIEKLVSRSQVLAITIMVPNSLGPAELILKHGTINQKEKYLKDLANGKLVPCFGLTEPNAGSDATSITSNGVIFKDENGEIKIRLNFEKRYITLGNVATLIGLAFVLKDPEHLLGDKEDLGITFAVFDSKLEGIDNSKRHDPLGIPFVNSPLYGKDVIIDMENIIGETSGIGKGWQMLVESLSIGRGISLPSVSLGGSKLALNVVASYSQLREQFGLSINHFEGVEEKIAKIAAFTYMLNASRNYTLDAIDDGVKPGVINSIMKYHATEKFRTVINDSMDVLGGSAIIRGENNLLAHAYFALPISITVEGANILTRNLMQFGQGLIKSHPYIYKQIEALNSNNVKAFDKVFFSHIGLVYSAFCKSLIYYVTRGNISCQKGEFQRYKQKLSWVSAEFTLLTNIALGILGPSLKKRENISARFGDILSNCYLITATLREFENNPNEEDELLVDYICNYCFNEIQIAREEIITNIGYLDYLLPIVKINPFSIKAKDKLNAKIVKNLSNQDYLQKLTSSLFISKDENDRLAKLQLAVKLNKECENSFKILKDAIKNETIKKDSPENMTKELLEKNLLSKEEIEKMLEAHALKQEIISVDSFDAKEYKALR